MSGLLRDLAGIVGERYLLTDPELLAGYEADWTRRYRGTASRVIRPALGQGPVARAEPVRR